MTDSGTYLKKIRPFREEAYQDRRCPLPSVPRPNNPATTPVVSPHQSPCQHTVHPPCEPQLPPAKKARHVCVETVVELDTISVLAKCLLLNCHLFYTHPNHFSSCIIMILPETMAFLTSGSRKSWYSGWAG